MEESNATERNPFQAPAADLSGSPAAVEAGGAGFTPGMVEHLHATKAWVRFLAALGFVGGGMMALGSLSVVVVGIVALVSGAGGAFGGSEAQPLAMLGAGVAYMLGAVIYIVMAMQLYRYGEAIVRVDEGGGAPAIEQALMRQRVFWKTSGVLTIVGLCAGLLIGILAVVAAIVGSSMMMR